MATKWFTSIVALGFVFMFSSLQPVSAAETKTMINIVFDDGVTAELKANQAKSQTQLADFMDRDMVRVFERYEKKGFEAKLINKREEFKAAPDNYLLIVKITEYNPGSKAARMIVGFGAGGVRLKVHYELFGEGDKPILSDDNGVFSGREWINAARKVNENVAKAVTEKLK